MFEQQKIFRIFQLLARLRSPLGCKKTDIAEDFDVSIRTIERYISLLKDLGFKIEYNQGRFKIPSLNKTRLQAEDMISFTLEEAQLIKNAIENHPVKHPLQKSLLSKLYAMAEMPELTETIFDQSVSNNISNLYHAIKYNFRVILKNYQSLNSNTIRDRHVEPLKLYHYNRYLAAWETEDNMIKEFKTERIQNVEITGEKAENLNNYSGYGVDIFGMTGNKVKNVSLKLSKMAYTLLTEEYPLAQKYIENKNYGYKLKLPVYKWEGIGRFVLGLPGEINVISPKEFKIYLNSKLQNY